MAWAYVDTSPVVGAVLGDPPGLAVVRAYRRFDAIYSSGLLEAELRSALAREGIDPILARAALRRIAWVLPDRHLGPEIETVLRVGRLRGTDLWHVACALYLAGNPADVTFLTLDVEQGEIARRVGFPTSP